MNTVPVLIYDSSCPLCQWYSGAFVSEGMLRPEGRKSFFEAEEAGMLRHVDTARCGKEIPLYLPEKSKTLYGVDSLVYLLSPRFPWIGKLMQKAFFRRLAFEAYRFVSFNRSIIPVVSQEKRHRLSIAPFRGSYRLMYFALVIFVSLVITGVWGHFSAIEQIDARKAIAAAGAGWFVYLLTLRFNGWNWKQEITGHVFTTMLLGAFTLPIAIAAACWNPVAEWMALVFIFGWMTSQLYRRLDALHIHKIWLLIWMTCLVYCFGIVMLLNN